MALVDRGPFAGPAVADRYEVIRPYDRRQERQAKSLFPAASCTSRAESPRPVSARTWRRREGERPGWPSEETAIVIHDALGRGPEDLGFTTPPGWIRPERHEEGEVKRRAFVSVTAAALVTGPVAPHHVDPALITYFQQQLKGHYRADMLLGPHDLIVRTSWCPPLTARSSTRSRSTVHSGLPDPRTQICGCRDYLRRRRYQPATSTMRMATTKAHTVVAPWYER
ncbi:MULTISPECIES: hypothetical protein [Streptomyces]|uniref:hypothetical protein n=1 Tax=Streptomyces sp. SID5469 TaxID=2690296 RepID=UPI001F40D214|nr:MULTISPECIES: hypothetical protein [Streptomyces]